MLRLPLNIDLSNQAPLEAVGRQSLLLALVFVGGITISILFSMRKESLLSLEVWASYLVLILVTVLIFFLSMYPTHRVLAQVKKKELELVRKQIQKTFREILRRVEENQPIDELPTQINTLTLYEQRIQASRSWPYNTAQLRTLFVSVIVPLATFLARRIGEMIYPQ
jgi:glucan phosphoethanolaminetransferase (alkaline phosphatase superfamily)